jgi:lactoylglutathione lyase
MIGIFVNDLHQMVAFYRDVLGLKIEWDGQGPYAEFKHEGIRFSMYEQSELPGLLGHEPSYPNGLNGTFELAIDLPTQDDVDQEFQRIVNSGAKPVYPPREEPWGMYSSMVMDPEGNLIELGSWKKGKPPAYELEVVTISVSNLEKSKQFYVDLLGFTIDTFYEPTKWLSFKYKGNSFCAIQEVFGFIRQPSEDLIDFYVDDVAELWDRIKDYVKIKSKLGKTPWGSYKFIIQDPDGYNLGFVEKK